MVAATLALTDVLLMGGGSFWDLALIKAAALPVDASGSVGNLLLPLVLGDSDPPVPGILEGRCAAFVLPGIS
jgi:hypothetical protein